MASMLLLNIIFLIIVVVSVILVLVLGILDFGDKWWDITASGGGLKKGGKEGNCLTVWGLV